MVKIPHWITIDSNTIDSNKQSVRCERCGQSEQLPPMPIVIDAFIKWSEYFGAKHEFCEIKKGEEKEFEEIRQAMLNNRRYDLAELITEELNRRKMESDRMITVFNQGKPYDMKLSQALTFVGKCSCRNYDCLTCSIVKELIRQKVIEEQKS